MWLLLQESLYGTLIYKSSDCMNLWRREFLDNLLDCAIVH